MARILDFCGPFPDGNIIYDLTARIVKDSFVSATAVRRLDRR